MNFSSASSRFSTQTIAALTEIVTGGVGSGFRPNPPIGIYRSGPLLEQFFASCNLELEIGNSRVSAVRNVLSYENSQPNGRETIVRIIEAAADPRDFLEQPEKLDAVVKYMNQRLTLDGFELRKFGNLFKVFEVSTNASIAAALKDKAHALDMESVNSDFERALKESESDPSSAITAACSTVESVCKCILDEMKIPYPKSKDIKGLVKEVAKHLDLSPGRDDLPKEWEQDIRTILSGLINVTAGIGSLRTHAGDAHGKGKNPIPADSRIARLAIHAASTVSLFYIETWQRIESQAHSAK